MNKRLAFLEEVVQSGKGDAFARYALGMEYRNAGRIDDAMRAFEELRAVEPDYLPVYLMAGQALVGSGDLENARGWLERGIELARRLGNGQALGELEAMLSEC